MNEVSSFLKQWPIRILLFGYIIGVICWGWLNATDQVNAVSNYVWSIIILGIFPVLGGIFGIVLSRKWGFLRAALGRAIFFLSCGVIAWGIGSLIWGYYNLFLEVEVPYPSLGDLGYLLSYPFYALGLINLGRGMGVGYKLRTNRGKILFVSIVVVSLIINAGFVVIARGGLDFAGYGIVKIFFDILYPLGDALIVTAVGLLYGLSYKVFGGRFKWPINLLFFGQFLLYLGDFLFSYTTTRGTYYVGDWNDLIFVNALFLITLSVNAMNISGISSRVRDELVMFAPRTSEAVNNLVSEIVKRQSYIIGAVAWDEATKVPGLTIDTKNSIIRVEGEPKVVLESLVNRYEVLFGNASLEVCRDASRKLIAQMPPEQVPEILRY